MAEDALAHPERLKCCAVWQAGARTRIPVRGGCEAFTHGTARLDAGEGMRAAETISREAGFEFPEGGGTMHIALTRVSVRS